VATLLAATACASGSGDTATASPAGRARAGAIITDSIPYAMALNPLVAAQARNIPILITDQTPDPAYPSNALLGYLPGPGATQLTALADWIIADSGGKARVLINMSTDSPSTLAYVAAAQAEFSDFCPGCTVVINKISSAGFSRIATSTRSALANHPGIDYVISEFEQYLQPTIGGIQQSGQAGRIQLASSAAQLDGLKMLKAPGLLDADAGQASAYQGWADADAVLRLMLKQPVQYTTIPIRLFTRTNVGDLALTPGAEESGAWFGSTGYVREYERLWGVG
jgi:ribose transport system substrate-binding protein